MSMSSSAVSGRMIRAGTPPTRDPGVSMAPASTEPNSFAPPDDIEGSDAYGLPRDEAAHARDEVEVPDFRPVPELDRARVEDDDADAHPAPDPIAEEASIQRPLHEPRQQGDDRQQRETRPAAPAHGT